MTAHRTQAQSAPRRRCKSDGRGPIAAGATAVGLSLRPTELLIFGNARGGTPLMQSVQTIGIDLPLKALVWQDASGDIWLSYNDPAWLAQRHGLGGETDAAIGIMTAALHATATAATTSE